MSLPRDAYQIRGHGNMAALLLVQGPFRCYPNHRRSHIALADINPAGTEFGFLHHFGRKRGKQSQQVCGRIHRDSVEFNQVGGVVRAPNEQAERAFQSLCNSGKDRYVTQNIRLAHSGNRCGGLFGCKYHPVPLHDPSFCPDNGAVQFLHRRLGINRGGKTDSQKRQYQTKFHGIGLIYNTRSAQAPKMPSPPSILEYVSTSSNQEVGSSELIWACIFSRADFK